MCDVFLLQQSSIKGDKISYRLPETSEIYYHAKRFYNPQERELQLHCYGTWKLTKTTNFMNCY